MAENVVWISADEIGVLIRVILSRLGTRVWRMTHTPPNERRPTGGSASVLSVLHAHSPGESAAL